MAEKVKSKSVKKSMDKWKRKQWFTVLSSKEFDEKPIGETPAEKEKLVKGRTVHKSLGELTNERQKRYIQINFRIREVKGQNALTDVTGHEVAGNYMNKMIRRRSSKIQTVQTVQTKDGIKVKLKTIAISQRKLDRQKRTVARKKMMEMIAKSAENKEFSPLIQLVIFGVLASKMFKELKKIAPMKRVEIVKSVVLEG